jgi:thioredoxin reductase (NADPH)
LPDTDSISPETWSRAWADGEDGDAGGEPATGGADVGEVAELPDAVFGPLDEPHAATDIAVVAATATIAKGVSRVNTLRCIDHTIRAAPDVALSPCCETPVSRAANLWDGPVSWPGAWGNICATGHVEGDMATREITAESFNETISENEIVLVDFWASWCGPCRQFAPAFEASSEKHPSVVHGKVDTEAQPQLAAAANIRSIPTLMAFKKGKLLFNQPGAMPPAMLEDLVQKVKDFDVDAVIAAESDRS